MSATEETTKPSKNERTKTGVVVSNKMQKTVVVANLAPRTMRGEISQGMLLAATDPNTNRVIFVTPSEPAAAGSKVS